MIFLENIGTSLKVPENTSMFYSFALEYPRDPSSPNKNQFNFPYQIQNAIVVLMCNSLKRLQRHEIFSEFEGR